VSAKSEKALRRCARIKKNGRRAKVVKGSVYVWVKNALNPGWYPANEVLT